MQNALVASFLAYSSHAGVRNLANKQDVPYQSLIKVFLSERIEHEFESKPGPKRVVEERHNKRLQRTAIP